MITVYKRTVRYGDDVSVRWRDSRRKLTRQEQTLFEAQVQGAGAVSELPPHTAFGEPLLSAEGSASTRRNRRWVYAQVEENGRRRTSWATIARLRAGRRACLARRSPSRRMAPIAGKCCARGGATSTRLLL